MPGEDFEQPGAFFGGLELGDGGYGAVSFVLGDFFYGQGFGDGFGEVDAGDLEAVEEEAGAFGVDVVGGEAAEDFADGELDGGAVFGLGEGEAGAATAAGVEIGSGDGFAGAVMVVAEFFIF